MKKLMVLFCIVLSVTACNENNNKTDKEKAEAEQAADSINAVDKAQEKVNELVDSAQSKGGKLIEAAGDTLKNKVVEPVKKEAKKVGDKIKDGLKEAKEKIEQ